MVGLVARQGTRRVALWRGPWQERSIYESSPSFEFSEFVKETESFKSRELIPPRQDQSPRFSTEPQTSFLRHLGLQIRRISCVWIFLEIARPSDCLLTLRFLPPAYDRNRRRVELSLRSTSR